MGLLLVQVADAQLTPYCNITSITSEHLNNAVRVRIDADGAISATHRKWWRGGEEGNYYLIWELVDKQTTSIWSADCYPKVSKIKLHLEHTRPQVGNVVWVGKYPVSHVRLMMKAEDGGGFGLDVEVVLHKPMRLRLFSFANFRMWDAYLWDHRDPACFEVVQTPDQRSLIVTVISDRLPEPRERRSLAEVPEQERELEVKSNHGLLSIRARNVALSDLVDRINQEAGTQLTVNESAASRLIVAELPEVSLGELAERIAQCYGLGLSGSPERPILGDPVQHTAAAQGAVATARLSLRHLRARLAADLLPNFLADHVNVDEQGNAVIASGPQSLTDKVASDLEKIDQPPTLVEVHSVVVESSSSADLAWKLGLSYSIRDSRLSANAALGGFSYFKQGPLPTEFEARLQALVEKGQAKLRGRSTLTVTGGQTGEMFVGVDKHILVWRRLYDPAPVVEPVSAGAKLSVTPWAGSRAITMNVTVEARAIGAIDPLTRLPEVDTRSAKGFFRISPGETVMISGLSQAQAATVVRRIPVLGDLPLIGGLFRWKQETRSASQFTVFLTASVAPPRSAVELDLGLGHSERGV